MVLTALAAAWLFAGPASPDGLPRLPGDITLRQSGDCPGSVVFSHQNHVAFQARVDCTACHPRLAPIVRKAGAKREIITHRRMEKGQACGACHNGKDAHGFDDCTTCHKG
jgi:c(7)-type cytochrome triheme protein